MQRTPQTVLTQSKLTGFTRRVEDTAKEPVNTAGPPPRNQDPLVLNAPTRVGAASSEDVDMEAPPLPKPGNTSGSQFITTDFLLRALKENTDQIVKSFTSNLGALSQRVEENTVKISQNTGEISKQENQINDNKSALAQLTSRVQALEGSGRVPETLVMRADLSPEFGKARRSVRVWPIAPGNLQDLWGDVGDFLHDTMRIPISELGQEDIEVIERVREETPQNNVKDEVIIRFFDKMLYANIKLPGDTSWTRVTPAMAREDLEASHWEENTRHQKKLASKLVPGPRERLGRPMPVVAVTTNEEGIRVIGAASPGKRPRLAGPPGRGGGSESDRPGGL